VVTLDLDPDDAVGRARIVSSFRPEA
jgi:hypothetical protein